MIWQGNLETIFFEQTSRNYSELRISSLRSNYAYSWLNNPVAGKSFPRGTGFTRFPRVFFELITPFQVPAGPPSQRSPPKLPEKLSKIICSIVPLFYGCESWGAQRRNVTNALQLYRSGRIFIFRAAPWSCLWRQRDLPEFVVWIKNFCTSSKRRSEFIRMLKVWNFHFEFRGFETRICLKMTVLMHIVSDRMNR